MHTLPAHGHKDVPVGYSSGTWYRAFYVLYKVQLYSNLNPITWDKWLCVVLWCAEQKTHIPHWRHRLLCTLNTAILFLLIWLTDQIADRKKKNSHLSLLGNRRSLHSKTLLPLWMNFLDSAKDILIQKDERGKIMAESKAQTSGLYSNQGRKERRPAELIPEIQCLRQQGFHPALHVKMIWQSRDHACLLSSAGSSFFSSPWIHIKEELTPVRGSSTWHHCGPGMYILFCGCGSNVA